MKTSHGIAIDGFVSAQPSGNSAPRKAPKISEASNLINSGLSRSRFKAAAQGVHERAQRSQTLMRTAVKKPVVNTAKSIAATSRMVPPKARTAAPSQQRVFRAQRISQSDSVQRFGHVESRKIPPAPVQSEAKAEKKAPPKASAAAAASNSVAIYKPLPSMLTSVSSNQLERMLDEALTRADSHKKTYSRRSGLFAKLKFAPRWKSIACMLVAVAAVGGYLAWSGMPQIEMRVASARAHVGASVPAFTPSGFSFAAPIKYQSGTVSIKFNANDNSGRNFTLTQQASKMDSKSLWESVVPQGTQVQTATVNGTTVYIYGNKSDASWVNNGVQYTIKDAANLNSDQLLKIASSL